MRRLPIESMAPTGALPRPLFHESGALLFAAGERVGDEEIALLRRAGIKRVYDVGGDEGPGAGEDSRAAPSFAKGSPAEPEVAPGEVRRFRRDLRAAAALRAIESVAGARLPEDRLILDPRGELRNGGVDRAIARCRTGERPEGTAWKERLEAVRPEAPRTPEEKAAALDRRASLTARLGSLFGALRAGSGPGDLAALRELRRDVCALAVLDPDLAIALSIGPSAGVDGDPLVRHSLAVASLSLATGIELGYALEQLVEIATAALLHDVGMVRLPAGLAQKAGALDDEERRELERHPLHAIEVLRRFPEVPVALAAVALEEHERPDGSGYPRGSSDTGELSKIVAVADVLEAIVAARPHRPGKPPHTAVREVVALAARKKLDSKVLRALLKAVSLFPVGSFVRLGDGAIARVVRAGGPDASRPLVAMVENGCKLVDLAIESEIKIADAEVAAETVAAFADDPLIGF